MAKKNGTGSASKMAEGNVKLGEIETAAASTMGPTDYSQGYPHQKNLIYPGKVSMTRGKPGGGSR